MEIGDKVRVVRDDIDVEGVIVAVGIQYCRVQVDDYRRPLPVHVSNLVLLNSSTRSQLSLPVSSRRGGARPGAGRPDGSGRWGEKTVVARVPESKKAILPKLLDLVDDLPFLLADWETRYQEGSVRSEVASKCASELRSILLDVVNL